MRLRLPEHSPRVFVEQIVAAITAEIDAKCRSILHRFVLHKCFFIGLGTAEEILKIFFGNVREVFHCV